MDEVKGVSANNPYWWSMRLLTSLGRVFHRGGVSPTAPCDDHGQEGEIACTHGSRGVPTRHAHGVIVHTSLPSARSDTPPVPPGTPWRHTVESTHRVCRSTTKTTRRCPPERSSHPVTTPRFGASSSVMHANARVKAAEMLGHLVTDVTIKPDYAITGAMDIHVSGLCDAADVLTRFDEHGGCPCA